LNLSAFKALVREQYYILLNEETAALAAIPAMLPKESDERRAAFEVLRGVLEASGALNGEAAERFQRLTELFDLGEATVSSEPTPMPARTAPRNRSA
jgi:Mg2+/Co2+ transporter CorB